MNGKQISKSVFLVALLMLTRKSQGQSTVDTWNNCPFENEHGFLKDYGEVSPVEMNKLQDLVAKMAVELKEQRTQLNALKQNNCSRDERLAGNTENIIELKRIFIEARFDSERNTLAMRSQLKDVAELMESMQLWNVTLVERLAKLELENHEQNEQLLFLRKENESLRTINSELRQQLSRVKGMQEQLELVNSSVQEQTDEMKVLLSEQNEQLRVVQRKNAVHEEQLTVLSQLNTSVIETVTWQQEMRTSLNEINRTMEERIAALERENEYREEQIKQTNGSLSKELAQLKEETSQQRQQMTNATKQSNDAAVAYIRWGRKVCPQNSTALYTGYAAGNLFSEQGGGSNYLCLPERPEWGRTFNGIQGMGALIHGVEYEMQTANSPFLTTNNGGLELLNANAPCTLCQATGRSTQIMIPARNNCPAGWYFQYRGYLVTSFRVHHKKEYICLDEAPEAIHGSSRNENGGLLYTVEAFCGSLPCPHYVNGWEIACVVCVR